MAFYLPLPGQPGDAFTSGLSAGTNLFNTLIQPRIKKREMEQQQLHHQQNMALNQEKLAQLMQRHQEEMALRKQAEGRRQAQFQTSQAREPLNLELLREQIEHQRALTTKTRNAPSAEQKRYQDLEDFITKEKYKSEFGASRDKNKLSEKFRSENLDSLEAAQDSLSDVEQADALLGQPGTPEYDYATSALGPLDAKAPAIREGTRKFRGEFNRLAGRMKANIARLEKGATSDKEREMFDKAEISESDTWTTAKGKLHAQKQYLTRLTERKAKIEELMDLGYPRAKALEISMKETPIHNQLPTSQKLKIRNKKTGEEREVTQEEYAALTGGAK